jgi:hypothetical protein
LCGIKSRACRILIFSPNKHCLRSGASRLRPGFELAKLLVASSDSLNHLPGSTKLTTNEITSLEVQHFAVRSGWCRGAPMKFSHSRLR